MNPSKYWPFNKRSLSKFEEPSNPHSLPGHLPGKPKTYINILLFLLTILTTTLGGALMEVGEKIFDDPTTIVKGMPFSFSLMAILLSHELGHYLVAKKYGLSVTLPYFIPAPPYPFFIGTFGAFIKMRSPVRDRRMLIDVGAAGPLIGVLVSLPFLFYGFQNSQLKPIYPEEGLQLGNSILLSAINWLVVGDIPAGYDVAIHPVGFAGWIGLLITSFNLVPIGQLDGGHVLYGLIAERQKPISKIIFVTLLILGVIGWKGWLFWGFIIYILGFRHPPPLEWWVPLDRRRKIIGWATMAVFILTFIPVPFSGF